MLRSAVTTLTLAIFFSAITASLALAATGTIISPKQYAWDDNGGYVNWYATGGNVTVTDTALTGYIWSAGFGWINLAPSNGGVTNSGGVLGGWAWGENTGWINFSGVTIDTSGVFHGHTVAQSTFGTMTFDCTYCDVATSWRVSSAPSSSTGTGSNGMPAQSGSLSFGYQTANVSVPHQPTSTAASTPSVPASLKPTSPPPTTEPRTAPKSTRTQNPPVSKPHTTSAPLPPVARSTVAPTLPASVYNQPPASTALPTAPSCSWFTCWLYDIWENIISHI